VVYLFHASRALDEIEESQLVPERKVLYQFSARGQELGQILLGLQMTGKHDAVGPYYRSRPLMLSLGLELEDAAAGPMARAGSFSDGRDLGVMFNMPGRGGVTALPVRGGVGSQYTPTAGWAQSIRYRRDVLEDASYKGCIAVAHGGDGSCATNGFWSALTIATTLRLPILFFVDDNGYSISVPSDLQTPGGNIAINLASFSNLTVLDGDGTDPPEAAALTERAVSHVRSDVGPVLLRLSMPRLCGHSVQDTQAYKSADVIALEQLRDPLPRLQGMLVPAMMSVGEWSSIVREARRDAEVAVKRALARPQPDASRLTRHVFSADTRTPSGSPPNIQTQGGLAPEGHVFPTSTQVPKSEAARINVLTAIRRTLDAELALNPKLLIFGEDVGPKGGVHGATLGLQDKFGRSRVFDTSLSEEGIIGRAIGMSLAGLAPMAEIQFRKYAEPAAEHLNDCGTMRWRTNNRFASPIVVRMAGGFSKCGDPWHSQTNEVTWIHGIGWFVAMPSNAEDAVGLLRAAMRGNDPVIFFEHRALLDAAWARRPYPGDDYVLPFGKARVLLQGTEVTVVSWGAMVERCEQAAAASLVDIELIDLRTLSPWDRESVLASVKKTRRCLIVHEDTLTAGFGAEIVAVVTKGAFRDLDAPVERLTMPDIPTPHSLQLLDAALPNIRTISAAIRRVASF
jgi:2-oxoisovalerate dehydrogenase E1 component